MNRKSIYGRTAGKIGCYAALLILAVIFVFPLYWFFLNSFKSYEQLFQYPPKFWVWPFRFANYLEAYKYPAFDFGQMMNPLEREGPGFCSGDSDHDYSYGDRTDATVSDL